MDYLPPDVLHPHMRHMVPQAPDYATYGEWLHATIEWWREDFDQAQTPMGKHEASRRLQALMTCEEALVHFRGKETATT